MCSEHNCSDMGAQSHSPSREHDLGDTNSGRLRCTRCGSTFRTEDASQIIPCVPEEEQDTEAGFVRAGEL